MADQNRNGPGSHRQVNLSGAADGRQDTPIEPYPIRSPQRRSPESVAGPRQTRTRSSRQEASRQRQRQQPKQKRGRQKPSSGPRQKKRSTKQGKKGKQRQQTPPPSTNTQRRRLSRGEMRRRRRYYRIITIIFVIALIVAGVILSSTVLFKVKSFRVENLDKTTPANTGIYTEEAILGALAVPLEENMFQFSAKEREKSMATLLPYLETIKVRRSLPSTVVVQVEPAVESWCVQMDTGWLVLSKGLKIMKQTDVQPLELPVLRGVKVKDTQPGLFFEIQPEQAEPVLSPEDGSVDVEAQTAAQKALDQHAQETLEHIQKLLVQLEEKGIGEDVTLIDLSQENEAFFVYQNRIKVQLGTYNNLDYKLGAAAKLLINESGEFLGKTDKGTLDVSHQMEGEVVRIPFAPGDIQEAIAPPSPPEETPQPETSPEPEQGAEPEAGAETQEESKTEGGAADPLPEANQPAAA